MPVKLKVRLPTTRSSSICMVAVVQVLLRVRLISSRVVCTVTSKESRSSTHLLGAAGVSGTRLTRMVALLVKFVATTNLRSKLQVRRLPVSSTMRGTLRAGPTIKTSTSLGTARAVAWSIRLNLASLLLPLVAVSLWPVFHRSPCSVWKTLRLRRPRRPSAITALT